jgi:flagellar basal body-associated protein FliL
MSQETSQGTPKGISKTTMMILVLMMMTMMMMMMMMMVMVIAGQHQSQQPTWWPVCVWPQNVRSLTRSQDVDDDDDDDDAADDMMMMMMMMLMMLIMTMMMMMMIMIMMIIMMMMMVWQRQSRQPTCWLVCVWSQNVRKPKFAKHIDDDDDDDDADDMMMMMMLIIASWPGSRPVGSGWSAPSASFLLMSVTGAGVIIWQQDQTEGEFANL